MTSADTSLVLVMDGDFVRNGPHPASRRFGYDQFLFRYAEVFANVRVIARVKDEQDLKADRADGPGVSVLAISYTGSVAVFLKQMLAVARLAWKIERHAAIILRVPGFFPLLVGLILILRRVPYGVEVMADPALTYQKGSYTARGRWLLALVMVAMTKRVCARARWASYVTRRALQDAYPPTRAAFETSYTTLNLPRAYVVAAPRTRRDEGVLRLVHVGVMQKHIKGQDIIIRALAILKAQGVPCAMNFVGDGENRLLFEDMVDAHGLRDVVVFSGFACWGDELMSHLDAADVFVLPSRQEGLPRALIEAKARGLVTYASDLPGNRELLDGPFIVGPNTPEAWAAALAQAHALRGADYVRESAASLAVAEEYVIDNVRPKRAAFYRTVARLAA